MSTRTAWGSSRGVYTGLVETRETDRERLRDTFNTAAQLYQRARPEYPESLFDRVIAVTGLPAGSRLLEVGCATGKATLPLARRGYRITCVELGAELADAARHNLSAFPDVEVVTAAFEKWQPDNERYDLVFAATAWHWVDPVLKYGRAAAALKPRGYLAFWEAGHVFPRAETRFSKSSRRSTTKSAKCCLRTRCCRGRANCRTSAKKLKPAGCSRSWTLRRSTG